MNVTIITIGRTNAEQGKYYNLQDVGLAKALEKRGHCIKLYNFIQGKQDKVVQILPNLTIYYIHAKAIGFHTIHSFDFISEDTDVVICYSDNQMSYKKVFHICKEKKILLIPYVGVIGSHNRNGFLSKIIDLLIPNNHIYRKQHVFAKTPTVKRQMQMIGIKDITIIPACLDVEQLKLNYQEESRDDIKQRLDIPKGKKVVLFIGRMIEEKRPEEMLQIFDKVCQINQNAYLIMIGKGVLLEKVVQKCKEMKMGANCKIIPQISNMEIWHYFRAADVFVNLNKAEIFGMTLLESMYYECPVVAWHAPGPDYIFQDGVNGFLCNDGESVLHKIVDILCARPTKLITDAKAHLEECFIWDSVAKMVEDKMLEWME